MERNQLVRGEIILLNDGKVAEFAGHQTIEEAIDGQPELIVQILGKEGLTPISCLEAKRVLKSEKEVFEHVHAYINRGRIKLIKIVDRLI